jgi:hypothetical protein
MPTARYSHDQAIARHINDSGMAEDLRAIERSNDFSDSFCYRAIRTRIGDALRAQYDVSEPLPRTFLTLLMQLDGEPKENAPRAPEGGSH